MARIPGETAWSIEHGAEGNESMGAGNDAGGREQGAGEELTRIEHGAEGNESMGAWGFSLGPWALSPVTTGPYSRPMRRQGPR